MKWNVQIKTLKTSHPHTCGLSAQTCQSLHCMDVVSKAINPSPCNWSLSSSAFDISLCIILTDQSNYQYYNNWMHLFLMSSQVELTSQSTRQHFMQYSQQDIKTWQNSVKFFWFDGNNCWEVSCVPVLSWDYEKGKFCNQDNSST